MAFRDGWRPGTVDRRSRMERRLDRIFLVIVTVILVVVYGGIFLLMLLAALFRGV